MKRISVTATVTLEELPDARLRIVIAHGDDELPLVGKNHKKVMRDLSTVLYYMLQKAAKQ